MRSELTPQAVIRIEPPIAVICAWCPDNADADEWAAGRGLIVTHGICPTCRPAVATEVIFEAGERCAAPGETSLAAASTSTVAPSRLVFSCRIGGPRK